MPWRPLQGSDQGSNTGGYIGLVSLGTPDLSYLERLCKGDRARMVAFVEQYLADGPRLFRTLAEASAKGDAKTLAHTAHDLRPHVHYVGAPELLHMLVAIDQEARQDPPVIRTDLVNALLPKVEVLNEALRATLGGPQVP